MGSGGSFIKFSLSPGAEGTLQVSSVHHGALSSSLPGEIGQPPQEQSTGALGGASTSVVVLVSALVRPCWLCAVVSVLCPEARGWTRSPWCPSHLWDPLCVCPKQLGGQSQQTGTAAPRPSPKINPGARGGRLDPRFSPGFMRGSLEKLKGGREIYIFFSPL